MTTIIEHMTHTHAINSWGDNGGTNYYGQVFTAAGSRLNSVEFKIDPNSTGGTDYTLLVATFTVDGSGNFHPGTVLFESPLQFLAGDEDNTYETVRIDTGNLALTPGQKYVFLLNANAGVVAAGGDSQLAAVSGAGAYAGGGFVYLNGNSGRENDFASNNWHWEGFDERAGVNTYGDLAFRLVFNGEQVAHDTASGGENERLVIDVLANDAEGLSLNTASAPAGKGSVSIVDGKLVFDPGTAFDRLAAGQTETVTLTYTARRNDEAPHSAEVTVTVTGANDRPFLASSLPDHTVLAGSQLNIIVSQGRFIDPDQGDRLTYSAGTTTGRLPDWISIDPVTGRISGVATGADPVDIRITATDTSGASTSDVFRLTVVATPVGRPPLGGTEGPDTLTGSADADSISALGGADMVSGLGGNDTIQGGSGLDVLLGNTGDDVIFGDGDSDILFGGQDNDLLDGGAANDILSGDRGNDTLRGGDGGDWAGGSEGDDVVYGEGGSDLLWGDDGNDILRGGEGDDTIQGGDGFDTVEGGAGADILLGNGAVDFVFGGAGADRLFGGRGDDRLDGGDDADWLSGDTGNDTLTGGAGADRFAFRAGGGADVVTDFSAAAGDRVEFAAGTTYSLSASGGNTVITLAGGDTLTLQGVQPGDLGDWAVFV